MTDPPPTITPIPARIAERYGVFYCLQCRLAVQYCTCDERSQDAALDVGDGDFSSLAARIREVRRMMGGRD